MNNMKHISNLKAANYKFSAASKYLVQHGVPPYIIAANEPLSYSGVNSVGLRRRGFSNEKITEIQDIYRYIYQRGINFSQAVALIEAEMAETEGRNIILDFIKSSDRGIIRGVQE